MEDKIDGLKEQVVRIAQRLDQQVRSAAEQNLSAGQECMLTAVQHMITALHAIDAQTTDTPVVRLLLRNVFRQQLSELCAHSLLWHRGLTKPSGYPGDFVMLDAIYRNSSLAHDTIGKLLDLGFLLSPLAKTVRKRKDLVVSTLIKEIESADRSHCVLLDLASGPCADVREVLARSHGVRIRFVCVDHDPETIAFARGKPELNGHVVFVQGNVLRIKTTTHPSLAELFDVVYSVGMLDYIPDKLARFALRSWWKLVIPGGTLLLTIKDRERYDPTFYDWMADWTFIPRTRHEFERLLTDSLPSSMSGITFKREETGVSIQATIRRTAQPEN